MDRLTRVSIVGSIISILLIIFKEDFYAKILAGLSLVIFCFMLIYHNYKKNKIMCEK
jgi:cellulose synthase/poly-beta-1,6-N-acetylglucosamine synthase-like glycosyltransferase